MTWEMAHARAMIRAAQAHRDLGIDHGGYVDVYEAIGRAGLYLYGEHLDELFGIYLPPLPGPGGQEAGVCLNTHRSSADQRHTAAHELGHHIFGHGECAAEITQVFEDPNPGTWPPQEKEAEAFAAWFLMPLAATRKVIRLLGIDRITRPDEVYQVALHLGASYRGMLRQLASLKLIAPSDESRWARVPRATLRKRAGRRATTSATSVWVLGPASHGAALHVLSGDRLLIETAERGIPGGGPMALPRGITPALAAEDGAPARGLEGRDAIEFDVTDAFSAAGRLHLAGRAENPWEITLVPARTLRAGLNEWNRPDRNFR